MNQEDKENVEEIREMLVACLEEEGYQIPQSRFKNDSLSGFKVVLRSGTTVEILMHF